MNHLSQFQPPEAIIFEPIIAGISSDVDPSHSRSDDTVSLNQSELADIDKERPAVVIEPPRHIPEGKQFTTETWESIPEPGSKEEAELLSRLEWIARNKANKLTGRSHTAEDLLQIARLGALYAVRRYNPERGSIMPFAASVIRGTLLDALKRQDSLIRVPDEYKSKLLIDAVEDAKRKLVESGQPATSEAISTITGIDLDTVNVVINVITHAYYAHSLEEQTIKEQTGNLTYSSKHGNYNNTNVATNTGEDDFVEKICDDDERSKNMQIIAETLKSEPELETLIQMRYGFPPRDKEHSVEEICAELGFSSATYNRRYRAARELLRRALADREL